MKVDTGKVLADFEQDSSLVEPGHRIAEVELFENDPGVIGKSGDIISEILACFRAAEGSKRVFGGVVERIARGLAKDQIEVESAFFMCKIFFSDLLPGRFKNAFEPSQESKGEDDLSEVGVLKITPEIFGVLSDEVRKCQCSSIAVFRHAIPYGAPHCQDRKSTQIR